mgnify:CR=1 FL=1
MAKLRKNISRFKRDVELTRHHYTIIKYTPPEKAARKRIRTQAKVLNKQLSELNKFKSVDSLSRKLLIERLSTKNMITSTGRIRENLPSDLKLVDYTAIEQAFKFFRKSESSTLKGIRRIVKRQRQDLLASTSNKEFVDSLSDREIMEFNKMYSDIAFDNLSRTMGSDTVKVLAEQAGVKKQTEEEFASTMEKYMDESPDENQRAAIKRIYKKYVSKLR